MAIFIRSGMFLLRPATPFSPMAKRIASSRFWVRDRSP
jgi:hypothetical protein